MLIGKSQEEIEGDKHQSDQTTLFGPDLMELQLPMPDVEFFRGWKYKWESHQYHG